METEKLKLVKHKLSLIVFFTRPSRYFKFGVAKYSLSHKEIHMIRLL